MAEISNTALALLLIFAIAFSLGGTMIALDKISGLRGITGMVTNDTVGSVNLSITSLTFINLTSNMVDFGTGYVGQGCSNCTMSTYAAGAAGGAKQEAACCLGFAVPGASGRTSGLVIENVGNTYVRVDINFTNTTITGGKVSMQKLWIYLVNNETQSCQTLGATWATNYAAAPTYNTGSENLGKICDILSPNQDNDSIRVHVNITIPDDAPGGWKNTTIIVTGTSL